MSTPAPDADDQLIDHIRQGGQPDPGDDVGRILELLRDRAQDPR